MKRRVLSALIFIFLSFSANAKVVNFFSPEDPEITLTQLFQFNVIEDSKFKDVVFSSAVDVNFQELYGSLGYCITDNNIDFTTQLRYSPTFWNFLKIGTETVYHFYKYTDYFVEHDLLMDLFLNVDIGQLFQITFTSGLFCKFSIVDAVKEYIPVFTDVEINFNFIFSFFPSSAWDLYWTFGTYSYYDYPLFLSAFFSTGAEWEFLREKISLGLELETKWYDFLVVSKNVGQLNIKSYIRWQL